MGIIYPGVGVAEVSCLIGGSRYTLVLVLLMPMVVGTAWFWVV